MTPALRAQYGARPMCKVCRPCRSSLHTSACKFSCTADCLHFVANAIYQNVLQNHGFEYKIAPLRSENLIFEVPGVPVEHLFRVEIASKIQVMLEHVSDHDFDRFLMDFKGNLGGYMGPKTAPRRVR